MSLLRRAWLWITVALGSVALALYSLWRRATRQRDEARAQRDSAVRSAVRERDLSAEVQAIETRHTTAGEIVQAKRVEAEKVAETRREETARAATLDELARLESARRRKREQP